MERISCFICGVSGMNKDILVSGRNETFKIFIQLDKNYILKYIWNADNMVEEMGRQCKQTVWKWMVNDGMDL
jgi:hypothetical protein